MVQPVLLESVREQLGLHHTQAAAAPVERVGAGVRIADSMQPQHQRGAVLVQELPAPVEQTGHDVDRGDRLGTVGLDLRSGGRDLGGDLQELVRVEQPAS